MLVYLDLGYVLDFVIAAQLHRQTSGCISPKPTIIEALVLQRPNRLLHEEELLLRWRELLKL